MVHKYSATYQSFLSRENTIHAEKPNSPKRQQETPEFLIEISNHKKVNIISGGFRGPKIFPISCSFSENLTKSYVGAP